MQADLQRKGIVRARTAAADSLLSAFKKLPATFSERSLADKWLETISDDSTVLPFGWYDPPPDGIAILCGNPPEYGRLNYKSLRDQENHPSPKNMFGPGSILYPYFSVIDKETKMIGDQVGTYYSGDSVEIKEWIRQAYHLTKKIAKHVRPGLKYSDLYEHAGEMFKKIGAENNTFSLSGGLAADIGHSVPFFGSGETPEGSRNELPKLIAGGRVFVSGSNDAVITNNCAFTIEPQIITRGLPMASFHMIVIVDQKEVLLVECFEKLFQHFKMDAWIY